MSFAVEPLRFFGRETISFILLLPIALPGIVTGMALSVDVRVRSASPSGSSDHRRPRHVLHRARLQQRHRPPAAASRSFEEASADLGARVPDVPPRDVAPFGSALLAGALLAFALSFDEVIVTPFTAGQQTLPIWILQELPPRPTRFPLMNVAGVVAILLSVIPVYLATRLSAGVAARRGRGATVRRHDRIAAT